jgi:hypothetical protein
MEKKKPKGISRESWERHVNAQRKLAERIAYHEAKLAEEKASRGQSSPA